MYKLGHETKFHGLLNILKSGVIHKSSEIEKMGLSRFQGGNKRRLAKDPKVSLYDRNFDDKYDEVDGVYFRLLPVDVPIKIPQGGDCMMVFLMNVLNDQNFVINTEENFGFCINEDGVISESQFSGEPGMSITKLYNLNLLNKIRFNPYSSEVLVTDNINLQNLKTIFLKKKLMNETIIKECFKKNIQLFAL